MSYLRATAAPLSSFQSSSSTVTIQTIRPTQGVSNVESTWQDGTWLVTKAALKITGLTLIGLLCLFVVKYCRRKQHARDLEHQHEYALQIAIDEQQTKASNVKQKLKIVKWKDISVGDDTISIQRDESTTSTASVHSEDDIEAQTASESRHNCSCSFSVSDNDGSDTSVSAPKSVSETIPASELSDADDDADDNNTCCYICLSHFESNELVTMSNNADCKHIFHKDCIASWLVKQDGCPICRRSYLEAKEDKEKGESDNSQGDSIEMAA